MPVAAIAKAEGLAFLERFQTFNLSALLSAEGNSGLKPLGFISKLTQADGLGWDDVAPLAHGRAALVYLGSWVVSQPPPKARMSSTVLEYWRLLRLASVRWLEMRTVSAVITSK